MLIHRISILGLIIQIVIVLVSRPLTTKQMIHLIHTQTLRLMNKRERINARANQGRCEEDVHAVAYASVHLRQALSYDQRLEPDTHACLWTRDRAQGCREYFGGYNP